MQHENRLIETTDQGSAKHMKSIEMPAGARSMKRSINLWESKMRYDPREPYTDVRKVRLTPAAEELALRLRKQFPGYIMEIGVAWVEYDAVPRLLAGFFEAIELGEKQKAGLSHESLLFALNLVLDEHEVLTIDAEGERFRLLGADMADLYPGRP